MKKFVLISIFMVASMIMFLAGDANAENKWEGLVEESGKVLGEVQEMPDQGIPEDLLERCQAIAVFPSTISAGFVIGGQYGQVIIMMQSKMLRQMVSSPRTNSARKSTLVKQLTT